MAQELVTLGIILLFVAIILIFAGSITSGKSDVKFGFGGFIGPIPFGFANDPRMLWIILVIMGALLAFFFFGQPKV